MSIVKRKKIIRKNTRKLLLRKFFLRMSADDRYEFLKVAETSQAYLQQIYGGHTLASESLAKRIEIASYDTVSAWHLRPDLFEKPAPAPAPALK